MDERDDDQWLDEPVVQALRAPGSEAELAREAEFITMFRDNRPRGGSVRRLIGRVGLGATTAVTTVVLSAGVAAAYTQVLPDPVQRIAHFVLGPVGVHGPIADREPTVTSAPRPGRPSRTPVATSTSTPTSTPTSVPTSVPTSIPSPTAAPHPLPTAPTSAAATSSAAPTPTPTGTPTPTPTATPTTPVSSPVPAALTVRASSRRVTVGTPVVVSGIVTDADRHPVAHRTVRLWERTTSGAWIVVASGRTRQDGRVSLTSPALTESAGLSLRTGHGVRSPVVSVVVVPVVNAALAEAGGTSSINVTVSGGHQGDQVVLLVRRSGRLVRIDGAVLDTNGAVVFSRKTPRNPLRIVVRVLATKRHAAAQTTVVVGPSG